MFTVFIGNYYCSVSSTLNTLLGIICFSLQSTICSTIIILTIHHSESDDKHDEDVHVAPRAGSYGFCYARCWGLQTKRAWGWSSSRCLVINQQSWGYKGDRMRFMGVPENGPFETPKRTLNNWESYDEAHGFLAAYFHTTSYNSNWGCLKIKGVHPIGEHHCFPHVPSNEDPNQLMSLWDGFASKIWWHPCRSIHIL